MLERVALIVPDTTAEGVSMTATTIDTPEATSKVNLRDRVLDACRHTAHVSHEAQLLETLAADAIEDGVHAANRAAVSARRGVEKLGDLKDEAAYRVKRHPLPVVGLALGLGLVLGVAVGWVGRGAQRGQTDL
jgi:hypothetical protein